MNSKDRKPSSPFLDGNKGNTEAGVLVLLCSVCMGSGICGGGQQVDIIVAGKTRKKITKSKVFVLSFPSFPTSNSSASFVFKSLDINQEYLPTLSGQSFSQYSKQNLPRGWAIKPHCSATFSP